MTRFLALLVLTALLPWSPAPAAEPWRATLESGHAIQVDPRSNRVTVHTESGVRQLRDGIHHLEDGTPIIVRSGVMTPNAALQEFQSRQRQPPRPLVEDGADPCLTLVRKTCGRDDRCAGGQGCRLARQLLALHREEREETEEETDTHIPGRVGAGAEETDTHLSGREETDTHLSGRIGAGGPIPASAQCRQALRETRLFPPCAEARSAGGPSPCRLLVAKVCGPRGRCADREACAPARQLLATEGRERGRYQGGATPTTKQCRRALEDKAFFTPCQR